MDQKILALVGKKQAGKSSAANFITGYTISQLGRNGFQYLPKRFDLDENGNLIVETSVYNSDGEMIINSGVLDLNRKDLDFIRWASDCMWPYVKTYAYADLLKTIVSLLFDVPEHLMYGTNDDKQTPTNVKWKNMCAMLPGRQVSTLKKAGKYDLKMRVRELLQFFGTNVCRKLYEDCWVNACNKQIQVDNSNLAIVTDCRFKNEIMAMKKLKAKIIKLERAPIHDIHKSEIDIDKLHCRNFDLIIPANVTMKEKNQIILDKLYEWGWFSSHVGLETVNDN